MTGNTAGLTPQWCSCTYYTPGSTCITKIKKSKIQKNWCTVTVAPTIEHQAPWLTFTDPCKPEVRPGAREESAFPAWLVAPAMNARDTTKCIYGGLTLDMEWHYIGSVTATTHQEKGIITLEWNPLRGTVLPAPHGKGNKCDKNVKYKRIDALSLWHQQKYRRHPSSVYHLCYEPSYRTLKV